MCLTLKEKLCLPDECEKDDVKKAIEQHLLFFKMTIASSQNAQVRSLAKLKLDELIESAKKEGLDLSDVPMSAKELPNSSSKLSEYISNKPLGLLNHAEIQKLNEDIDALPESAYKNYLKATVILSEGELTEEKSMQALRLVETAIKTDPGNFVYKQVATDIRNSLEKYQLSKKVWLESEKERLEKEKKIETTKNVFAGIGKGILYVLGGIAALIGGAFVLLCECFDSCDC